MSADPFARIRCDSCGKVHWPQLPCLKDEEQREDDLRETGLVGAAEARGEEPASGFAANSMRPFCDHE